MFKLSAMCVSALLLQPLCACAGPAALYAGGVAPGCMATPGKLDEKGYVSIGGIEQWVTIKGDSCANPVILFLHGGPGNPLSPYADAVYGGWTSDFTLVQWDQRGAGMTYGRNPPGPGAKLSIAQMRDDGAQLAAWLAQRLGKQKIILWGSSWGSILGVHMAKAHPELFYAYLGTSQVVSYRDNQPLAYARLLGLAQAAADQSALAILRGTGAPPWSDPRSFGKVRRVMRKYEAKVSTPAPPAWWKPAPAYAGAAERRDYDAGEDYSFINFVGMQGDGLFSQVELPALGTEFAIPMFFIHGAHDLLATPDVLQRYYASLKAPQKELVILERTGHDPNQAVVDAQYKLLVERIRPLAN